MTSSITYTLLRPIRLLPTTILQYWPIFHILTSSWWNWLLWQVNEYHCCLDVQLQKCLIDALSPGQASTMMTSTYPDWWFGHQGSHHRSSYLSRTHWRHWRACTRTRLKIDHNLLFLLQDNITNIDLIQHMTLHIVKPRHTQLAHSLHPWPNSPLQNQ
jgi:hypothetical protein